MAIGALAHEAKRIIIPKVKTKNDNFAKSLVFTIFINHVVV